MEGTKNIAHTSFLLQLVHKVKTLVGLVKMAKMERLGKKTQITESLKSISQKSRGAKKTTRRCLAVSVGLQVMKD